MVSFPPLAPDSYWIASYLHSVTAGLSTEKAIWKANESLASSKSFGRYTIIDTKGNPITLSLSIEGGGRQLRSFSKLEEATLSEHGDWRRTHLRALETYLGKKPYYLYLEPELKEVYFNKNLQTLREFNLAILRIILAFILKGIDETDLNLLIHNDVLLERGKEIIEKTNPEISSLQMISTHGKEALTGFLALNK